MKQVKNIQAIITGLAGFRRYDSLSLNTGLLILRFYAGITIMGAGLDKLPLTDWMVDQVHAMGFPYPVFFGWMASFSEFAFGLLLALGLMTRWSGTMLAITMGVASFGFQKVLPLVEMHIAQLYTWSFVLFIFSGAGHWSLDRWVDDRISKHHITWVFLGPAVFSLLLAYGLLREYSGATVTPDRTEAVAIKSVSVPGSFNNWDPASDLMSTADSTMYNLVLEIAKPGPVEFKFALNQSWEVNLGENDQDAAGFPISGTAESNESGEAGNIKAYLPGKGRYMISLNLDDLTYSLDSIRNAN